MKPCNNGWKNVLCLKKGHSKLFWNHANLVYLKYSCLLKPLHPSVFSQLCARHDFHCCWYHWCYTGRSFLSQDVYLKRFEMHILFIPEGKLANVKFVCVYLCECALCLCECVFSFSVHFLRKSMFMIYVSWLLWILFIIKFYYEKNEKIVYR